MSSSANLIEQIRQLSPAQLASLDDDTLAEVEFAVNEVYEEKTDSLCADKVASFAAGPLYWLTQHTKTENPKWEEQGVPYKAPFPQRGYFVPLFDAFLKSNRLFIPKSRELMTSWCAVGYAVWRAQWFKWDFILQTGSLGKVVELISYAAQLYRNQPEWLKARHPLSRREPTQQELSFADGGRVLAIPSGSDKIRLYHPTGYILDEAAFQPEAEECFNTAQPVAQQIIAISTAAPGFFADQCAARVTPTALEVSSVSGPRPDPFAEPEPEPEAEKTLEQEMEEIKQRILNPVDPALALFVQRRDEEQARRSPYYQQGAYSSVREPLPHPADIAAQVRQLEDASAECHGKRKP